MGRLALTFCVTLLLAGTGRTAYPTTDEDLAIYFGPLRTHYAGLGAEFVFWATGDSWTCNAQSPGETVSWSADAFGAASPSSYIHANIWGDPTTCNGASWMARLAYRLKTHRFGAEAIGGAQLSLTEADPPVVTADSTILSWIDDAAAFSPDIWLLYGGINDLLGNNASYTSIKRKYLLAMDRAYTYMPSSTRMIVLTLQPCGIDYVRMKIHNQAPWNAMSYSQVFEACRLKQVRVDSVNVWLKDSLRIATHANFGSYDTTRLFVYDHVRKLQKGLTWTAGAAASLYPHALGGLDAGDRDSQADSVKWATLRVLRAEIESDSIHCNQRGLRQIGDSLAVGAFGIDLGTWTVGTHATLYVDKANGNNWTNRGRETSRSTPLATIQCATYRAWPGDTIHVIGTGNQALLTASTQSGGPTPASNKEYELVVNKPGLYYKFDSGAYYKGVYSSGAKIFGSSLGTTVGYSFFNQVNWSGGDGYELSYDLTYAGGGTRWSTTATTYNALINMGGMVIDGLKCYGYYIPILLPNVTNITFKNSIFYGGENSDGAFQSYGYGYYDTTPDPLTINLDACTFYTDSSATLTANTGMWGRLIFQKAASLADSTTYAGTISNCSFIGDAWNKSNAMISGRWDGMVFVGNTFTDPSSYNYVVNNDRSVSGSYPYIRKQKWINNKFDVEPGEASLSAIRLTAAGNGKADSILVVNNIVHCENTSIPFKLYQGPLAYTTTGDVYCKSWFARNIATDWDTLLFDGNGTARSLKALYDGSMYSSTQVVSPDTITGAWQRNYAGRLSINSDTMKFGGIKTTTRGSVYNVSSYGVNHPASHVSMGPLQYSWPTNWNTSVDALTTVRRYVLYDVDMQQRVANAADFSNYQNWLKNYSTLPSMDDTLKVRAVP